MQRGSSPCPFNPVAGSVFCPQCPFGKKYCSVSAGWRMNVYIMGVCHPQTPGSMILVLDPSGHSLPFRSIPKITPVLSVLPIARASQKAMCQSSHHSYAFIQYCNITVIKAVLSQLPKKEFIQHANFIKYLAINAPWGNRRSMYVRLYHWCKRYYKKHHL
jgi:hypothetical protein